MRRTASCLLVVGVALLLPGTATAAEPDLRLVGAAAGQDHEAVRTLLREGVDVDAARADGVTALLWAAHWDDIELVELLLEADADVNAAEDHGVTPLARASENASADMVTRLLAAGADPNAAQTSGLTPLMIAARTGSVDVVRALLAAGADPNAAVVETGATALMWAMEEAHAGVVHVLLEQGATISASTNKGFTPLMTAARYGNIDLAKILIEAGADVNATGSDGTHALPVAILHGQYEFAHFLLAAGADPNASMAGIHALHAAAGKVDHWLTHWDREHGRNTRGSSRISNPGLGMEGRLGMVKALLARGADPNVRITTSAMFMSYIGWPERGAFERYACGTGDLLGATPLWVAAFGANTSFGQVFGEFAVLNRSNSSPEIIEALLDAGADLSLTTVDGTTPLMAAAGLGAATYTPREPRGLRSAAGEEAVKVLLAAGADINQVNEADFTALHGAAFRGLNEIVQILVDAGADIDARDFRGRTPYRLAEGSKQSFQFQSWPETAALLRDLGADTRLGIPGSVQERADREVAE